MDEPMEVMVANGPETRKRRDIFFYPWEDRSPEAIRRFVAEQRRITEKSVSACQYCSGTKMKRLTYFDDQRGRRHVQSACTDCWNDLGYVSDVPNPGNKMPFGEHKGESMMKLYRDEPGYITWFIASSIEGDPKNAPIIEAMKTAIDGANTESRTYVIPPESFLKKLEEEAIF